jgi:hypothetical protein
MAQAWSRMAILLIMLVEKVRQRRPFGRASRTDRGLVQQFSGRRGPGFKGNVAIARTTFSLSAFTLSAN